MSERKVGVGVTLDPKIIIKAGERAEKANRSFSNYVESALRQMLNGQDLKKIATKIYDLFQEKDFPEILDIQSILKKELER